MRYLLCILLFSSFCVKAQKIITVAGNGGTGYGGDGGLAISTSIDNNISVICDTKGGFYFVERLGRVLKVNSAGIINTVAGNGTIGFSGDSGLATAAQLNNPLSVALDSIGNLYIADFGNQRIRKVNATTGIITTIAGNGTTGYSGDGGLAKSASLNYPNYICLDKYNNIYIADGFNQRIRKVNAISGTISTVVGNGMAGYSADGGLADTTRINEVNGMCIDTAGDLYIADFLNYRVRKVNVATKIITTVAGNGISGYNGDGIAAISSEINPWSVAISKSGNLYIADWHARIRKVDLGNTGIITTVAGNGTIGFSGDGGLATLAEIYNPEGLALDTCGNLYISDNDNKRIRKVIFDSLCGKPMNVLNSIPENEVVNVYPNPARKDLTLSLSHGEGTYCVMNIIGTEILHGTIKKGNNKIDVSGLCEGVYFIEVGLTPALSHGEGGVIKIVKQFVKE